MEAKSSTTGFAVNEGHGKLPIETETSVANPYSLSLLSASTQLTPSYQFVQASNSRTTSHTPLSTCITAPVKPGLGPGDIANISLGTGALSFAIFTLGLKYYWKHRKDRSIPLGGGGEYEVRRRWSINVIKESWETVASVAFAGAAVIKRWFDF
ncbi:hypothetical protein K440DRAFT_660538 [Wilcoxina mikolae CBS 423.85]|nr:hypothetical protein K440DRAFT_660538 [Wilcoxina mikolae CBS 423.85]